MRKDRHGLNPSLAAEYEFHKVQRDLAGKWHGDGSDSYVRSLRATLYGIQEKLISSIRDRPENHDESEMMDQLVEYLRGKGVDEFSIRMQQERLDHNQYWVVLVRDIGITCARPQTAECDAIVEEEQENAAAAGPINHSEVTRRWESLELARRVEEATEGRRGPSMASGYAVHGAKSKMSRAYHNVAKGRGVPDGLQLRNAMFKEQVDDSDFPNKCKDCYPELRMRAKAYTRSFSIELRAVEAVNDYVYPLEAGSVSSLAEDASTPNPMICLRRLTRRPVEQSW